MTRTRTNFKIMNHKGFIAYLEDKSILFEMLETTTVLGLSVLKIIPKGSNMKPRLFDASTSKQLDPKLELTEIDFGTQKSLEQLIKIIDNKINNMSTKGVYHPRRLKPKWFSLKTNKQKLELFRKYMKAPTSSIGFLRLIEVNLPSKTMESIIIEHPEFEKLINIDGLRQKCIDKFKLYENGKLYLKEKGLI